MIFKCCCFQQCLELHCKEVLVFPFFYTLVGFFLPFAPRILKVLVTVSLKQSESPVKHISICF